jgi:hypothetical protein
MNQTGYTVLKIPKNGAAFTYAKEARDFATGATGVGGYLNASATASGWSDVRFVSAIREASDGALPVSIGATASDIYTGATTVIGGTTPIGDLRSENGPYSAVGSSDVYNTKKGEEYRGAFYATYIGGTNSLPTKIGVGTSTASVTANGYFDGSFTTNDIHEFQTSFTADSTDLSKITTGSGVYTEGADVTLQFNILNRNGEQLSSAAQIAADPFVSGQKISILNTDGTIAFSDYRIGGDSTFTFSSSQNIDVFGTFTRNFGIRNQVVNQDGGVHTSEFYLYANTATFDKVFVRSSGQTVLNESYTNNSPPNTGSIPTSSERANALKYFNNQPINDSGVTGFIEFDLGFNESPNFTSLGDLVVFYGTGEDFETNRGSLVGNFPLNSVQEGQRIRLTANDGIPEATGLFFKLAADTEVGFNEELFTVGPFTLEPEVEGPDLNLYNQGDQTLVGDFTIEGGLEGDDADGGNLNVSGNALGTGEAGRLTGPTGIPYLLSGDAAGGGSSDTLQDVVDRDNATTTDINYNGSKIIFNGDADKSIGYSTDSPEGLLLGADVESIKSAHSDQFTLFPNQSVAIGASAEIIGASPATGSAVLGGTGNRISGHFNTLVGGAQNKISGDLLGFNFIGGGSGIDVIDSQYSSSVGGYNNDVLGSDYSVIAGGHGNKATGVNGIFIGGGFGNTAKGGSSVIVGGQSNTIHGNSNRSFIGAGASNVISGEENVIGGGNNHLIEGSRSVILGGDFNEIKADDGVVAGSYSKVQAGHGGAFVFSDSNSTPTLSTGANAMVLNFAGGVHVPTSGVFGEGLFVSGVPVLTGENNPAEADTLQTVTARGNTTNTSIFSTGPYISGVTGLFNKELHVGDVGLNSHAFNFEKGDGLYDTNIVLKPFGNPAGFNSAYWMTMSKQAYSGFITNGNSTDFYIGHDLNKTALKLKYDGGGVSTFTTSNTDINFEDGTLFVDESAQRVGIGTTGPQSPLEVTNDTSFDGIILKDAGGGLTTILGADGSNNSRARFYNGSHQLAAEINANAGSPTYFNAGDVGIGTNSPDGIFNTSGGHVLLQGVNKGYVRARTARANVSDYTNVSSSILTLANYYGQNEYGQFVDNAGSFVIQKSGLATHLLKFSTTDMTVSGYGIKFAKNQTVTSLAVDLRNENGDEVGFYSPATNEIGFVTDRTEHMRIDSAGNVGVGTENPNSTFHVEGVVSGSNSFLGTGDGNRITNNGVPYLLSGDSPAENDTLQDVTTRGNTTTTSILSTGPYISGVTGLYSDRVGIGTTDPDAPLHVKTSSNINTLRIESAYNESAGGVATIKSTAQGSVLQLESATTSSSRQLLDVKNSDGTVFEIQGDGLVGIGTTDPDEKLEVHSGHVLVQSSPVGGVTPPSLKIGQVNNAYQAGLISSTHVTLKSTNGAGEIIFMPANTYKGIIKPNGNMGVNTITPNSTLHVEGDITGAGDVLGTGVGNRITNNGTPYLLSGDSPAETQNLDQVLAQGNTSTRDMSVADISGSGLFLSGAGSAGPEISLQGTYTTWEIENQYAGGANNDMFRIRNAALGSDALVINRGNNKVGLGTTNPSEALDVAGNIFIGANDLKGAANCKIEMDAADGFTLTNPNNAHGIDIVADDLTFFGGGLGNRKITTNAGDLSIDPTADLLLNETAGNVGIGTDNPTERVEVSGSLLLGPRSSSAGDTMPFLKIDGYDEHGIEMGWGTWTKWKITTKVNGQLEIYNTGVQHQSQQVSIGRKDYHKQGNLMVYSTGSVLRAGHNTTSYAILDIGVQDAVGTTAYQGDAYIDVRPNTSTASRFHFKRDGEFIASGVSVSGDVLGTGVGNRITNNHVPYLLSGDSPAETQTLQDVCDNGNTTTTSIISTGPHISGVTGLYSTVKIGEDAVAGGRLITADSMIFQIDCDNTSSSSSYRFRKDSTVDAGTELMRIQEDGNVGIGTDAPSQTLHVKGIGIIEDASSSSFGTLQFGTDASRYVRGNSAEIQFGSTIQQLHFQKTNGAAQIGAGASDGIDAIQLLARNVHTSANIVEVVNGNGASPIFTIDYTGNAEVTGSIYGTGAGNRITKDGIPYLLSGDSPAETQTLQDVCDNGNETTTSILSTGPYISGVTGLFEGSVQVKGANGWAGADTQGGSIYISTEGQAILGNMGGNYARPMISSASNAITIGSNGTSAIRNIKYHAGNGAGAADSEHNFYTSGNNVRMHIAKDGNVGIGTSSPDAFLNTYNTGTTSSAADVHIVGSGNTYGLLVERLRNDSLIVSKSTTAGSYFKTDSATASYQGYEIGSTWFMGQYGYNDFRITDGTKSGGTAALTIQDSTQNVGIGTTNPADTLQVAGQVRIDGSTTDGLTITSSAGASQGLLLFNNSSTDTASIINYYNGPLLLGQNNAEVITIDNDSVGINVAAPAGDKLMVKAENNYFAARLDGATTAGQSNGLRVRAGYNSTDRPVLIEKADGSDVFIIDGLGNVGIGSSPSYELDVNGTTRSTYYIGGAYLEENASSSKLKLYPDGTVLVINKDGELEPCKKENDTLVFGVSKIDFDSPVVLGAEPVLVTGPVEVGDYIVTSNKQGHGKAVKDLWKIKLGTVIAQAMESGDGESYNIKAMVRKM